MDRRPPIIFAGMHRSGTSFTASYAREAGIDIGDRLIGASPGNDLGHFENEEFVRFHERQLALHGYAKEGWIVDGMMRTDEGARADASALIAKNAKTEPWGWKDPRTTLFLDFWHSMAPEARFVLVYRRPVEVIASLFRRRDAAMGLSPEIAARSWLCHNSMMLAFVREHRDQCVLANLSAIVANPKRFLELMSERFDIGLNLDAHSPFRSEMLHALPENALATLVQHFVPEIASVYADLEQTADLPGGVPALRTDARSAFFNFWFDSMDDTLEQALIFARKALDEERVRGDRLSTRIAELDGQRPPP